MGLGRERHCLYGPARSLLGAFDFGLNFETILETIGIRGLNRKIKHTPHNYAYNIQYTTLTVQCTAKESEHTVPGMQGGPAAGGGAHKIRRAAFSSSSAVPAAFETMLSPTLRRRSAKYTSELVFS